MKRTYQAVCLALTLAASASLFAQAPVAGAPGGTKIGVIDIQTAILATNEGQREFTNLQNKFTPRQTEIQNMSKEVDTLQKQLDTQGGTLSDEARENLVKQIDGKKKTLQRTYEDAQNDFESQKNDILKNLFNKVYTTLDKYAKDNGYGVIMDVSTSQTVLWASQPTNITKAVVDAYNVASGVPAPAAPAGAAPKPTGAAPSTTRPSTTSH
jgi:outer membrane protein